MSQRKPISKMRQKIHELYEKNEYESLVSNQTRARSIAVGNGGGRVIEISMRSDISYLWYHMHQEEVVELIGQLASASGVEVAVRPRNDFATYRDWDLNHIPSIHSANWQISEEDRKLLNQVREVKNKLTESSNKENGDVEYESNDESN
jgi:hypothetical protein